MARLPWTRPSYEGNLRCAQIKSLIPWTLKELDIKAQSRCRRPARVLLVSWVLAVPPASCSSVFKAFAAASHRTWTTAASLALPGLDGEGRPSHISMSRKQGQTDPDPTESWEGRLRDSGPEMLSYLPWVTQQVGGRAGEEPRAGFSNPLFTSYAGASSPPGKLFSVPCHACGFKFQSNRQLFHLRLPGLGVITWPCIWLT